MGSAGTPVITRDCGISDFARMPGVLHAPKPGAIPTSLYPDIQFLPLYHGEGENQRFFCLWSFLWSKPLLCCVWQSGEIPQTQVSQDFAAFHNAPSRIPPRHSQSRRATNCATPGYFVILSGWSYSPKPGAIPTSLYPNTTHYYSRSKCACPVLYIAFCILWNPAF